MEKGNSSSRRDKQTDTPRETQRTNGVTTAPAGGTAGDGALHSTPRGSDPAALTKGRPDPIANAELTIPADLGRDLFHDDRDDVLTVINELEDQLDRYQEIRATLERQLAESTEQNVIAGQRVQELEWQTVTLQTRIDALEQSRQELASLEDHVAEATSRAIRTGEELQRVEKENERVTAELKQAAKQLEELWAIRKERDGLRTDLRTLRARLDEMERGQREWVDERNTLSRRLTETQLTLDESRTSRQQLEQDMRTAVDRANEAQRAFRTLEEKIESLRTEKKNFQAQILHYERENSRLVEQRQFYESELTSVRNSNRQTEAALASIKKAFAEVRVALGETRTRARRRTMDYWPRVGTVHAGLGESVTDLGEAPASALAGGPASVTIGDDHGLGVSYGDLPKSGSSRSATADVDLSGF